MKKLLFAFPIVVLLAAGCNSSQQAVNPTPTQTQLSQTTTPTPTATAVISNPTATPSPTSSPTAADWKTYSDTTDGFQISYPQDWQFAEDPQGIGNYILWGGLANTEFGLSAPTDNGWRTGILVYQAPMTQVINAEIGTLDSQFGNNKATSSSQTITINGNEWTKVDITYYDSAAAKTLESLLIEKGGSTYVFDGDYNGSDPQYGSIDTNIFKSFIITK